MNSQPLKGFDALSSSEQSLQIVNRSFTQADVESLTVTLNIRRDGLEWLANEAAGAKFRSKDSPSDGETEKDVQNQITAVYDTIGRRPIGEMASLAARSALSYRYDSKLLTAYGDIVLVMDSSKLASDLVIFNGDVKNLGARLVEERKAGRELSNWLVSFGFDPGKLDSQILATSAELDKLWKKITQVRPALPRIVGKYCEARLFRELRALDVSKVFIPEVAKSEMTLVEELKQLKQRMRKR
jgi:hypothetical protein